MAIAKGRDYLVKVGDGGAPEAYTTIAGMRTTAMAINNSTIDVTTKDAAFWRALASGGIKNMSISLAGVMNDAASIKTMMSMIFSTSGGDIANFLLVSGLGHSFQGSFQIVKFDEAGDLGKEELYTMTLENNGVITYTPAP